MAVSLNGAVREIIDGANPAVLATINPDGDDLLISTAAGRRKERNLRRDPRASVCVIGKADPGRYVEVRGLATVTEDPGRQLAVRLAEAYEGPGAGEEFLRLPPEVIRVVVRIAPQRVVGSAAG